MKAFTPIALVLVSFWGLSCEKHEPVYRFATGTSSTSYYKVGRSIAEIVYKKNHVKLEVLSEPVSVNGEMLTPSGITNCKMLLYGAADFALSQNDVPIEIPVETKGKMNFSGIRSVLPLYPQIFFILYKDSLNPRSLHDLIVDRKVAMGPRFSGTATFTKRILEEFGLDTTQYAPYYLSHEQNVLSDSVDISCLLTGFDNPRIEQSLKKNGRLFSLGAYQLAERGSAVDGFCLKYPLAKPYLIPINTFGNILPQEPILTAAIDAVLLAREEVSEQVVYSMLKTILDNKQMLAMERDNRLLSQITDRFDPHRLRFPLHAGAQKFLSRDQPTFLERYAEMLAFLFSLLLALMGGFTTIARWNKQRKKDRIDSYYEEILKIQTHMQGFASAAEHQAALVSLRALRENAFRQLIAEKLFADESFRIFITFVNDTQSELQQRLQALLHK